MLSEKSDSNEKHLKEWNIAEGLFIPFSVRNYMKQLLTVTELKTWNVTYFSVRIPIAHWYYTLFKFHSALSLLSTEIPFPLRYSSVLGLSWLHCPSFILVKKQYSLVKIPLWCQHFFPVFELTAYEVLTVVSKTVCILDPVDHIAHLYYLVVFLWNGFWCLFSTSLAIC